MYMYMCILGLNSDVILTTVRVYYFAPINTHLLNILTSSLHLQSIHHLQTIIIIIFQATTSHPICGVNRSPMHLFSNFFLPLQVFNHINLIIPAVCRVLSCSWTCVHTVPPYTLSDCISKIIRSGSRKGPTQVNGGRGSGK